MTYNTTTNNSLCSKDRSTLGVFGVTTSTLLGKCIRKTHLQWETDYSQIYLSKYAVLEKIIIIFFKSKLRRKMIKIPENHLNALELPKIYHTSVCFLTLSRYPIAFIVLY